MKAYQLERYGKGQRLILVERPDPVPASDEVLVEIHATAINQLDGKIRDGAFKPILPYKPPFVLGHDLAGIVTAVGAGVRRFKVGDAVYARPRDGQIGTFAERIAIHEADLATKPAGLSMAEAASIPLVGLTAWQVLIERAGLKRGQKILIHAGSGGVGTIAIQLAKHLGATVATTASAANADLVRRLGADIVIDYKTQDFSELLSGYDVVLNSLDAKTLEKSLVVLKPGGKLISISGPPDPAFAEALAADRPVFAFDYRGVGASGGEAPLTVSAMADDMLAAIDVLGLDTIDLMGFSLGGFVAQDMVLKRPALVRRLILTGTGPAGGTGIDKVGSVSWPLIVKGMLTFRDPKMFLFFTASKPSRRAAQAFLARLKARKVDRDAAVTPKVFLRQLKAITAWGAQSAQDLGAIRQPVLVANGDHDIMVPSENSRDLARRIPGAELVLYPDAGHGGIFQYHELFADRAIAFLDT